VTKDFPKTHSAAQNKHISSSVEEKVSRVAVKVAVVLSESALSLYLSLYLYHSPVFCSVNVLKRDCFGFVLKRSRVPIKTSYLKIGKMTTTKKKKCAVNNNSDGGDGNENEGFTMDDLIFGRVRSRTLGRSGDMNKKEEVRVNALREVVFSGQLGERGQKLDGDRKLASIEEKGNNNNNNNNNNNRFTMRDDCDDGDDDDLDGHNRRRSPWKTGRSIATTTLTSNRERVLLLQQQQQQRQSDDNKAIMVQTTLTSPPRRIQPSPIKFNENRQQQQRQHYVQPQGDVSPGMKALGLEPSPIKSMYREEDETMKETLEYRGGYIDAHPKIEKPPSPPRGFFRKIDSVAGEKKEQQEEELEQEERNNTRNTTVIVEPRGTHRRKSPIGGVRASEATMVIESELNKKPREPKRRESEEVALVASKLMGITPPSKYGQNRYPRAIVPTLVMSSRDNNDSNIHSLLDDSNDGYEEPNGRRRSTRPNKNLPARPYWEAKTAKYEEKRRNNDHHYSFDMDDDNSNDSWISGLTDERQEKLYKRANGGGFRYAQQQQQRQDGDNQIRMKKRGRGRPPGTKNPPNAKKTGPKGSWAGRYDDDVYVSPVQEKDEEEVVKEEEEEENPIKKRRGRPKGWRKDVDMKPKSWRKIGKSKLAKSRRFKEVEKEKEEEEEEHVGFDDEEEFDKNEDELKISEATGAVQAVEKHAMMTALHPSRQYIDQRAVLLPTNVSHMQPHLFDNKPKEANPEEKFCLQCQRSDDDYALLVCGGCSKCFHTFCLVPRVTKIPEGDWFCYDCVANGRNVVLIKKSNSNDAVVDDKKNKEEDAEEEEGEKVKKRRGPKPGSKRGKGSKKPGPKPRRRKQRLYSSSDDESSNGDEDEDADTKNPTVGWTKGGHRVVASRKPSPEKPEEEEEVGVEEEEEEEEEENDFQHLGIEKRWSRDQLAMLNSAAQNVPKDENYWQNIAKQVNQVSLNGTSLKTDKECRQQIYENINSNL
jgi:hypothetical protein